MNGVTGKLLQSTEPSVRYRVQVHVLGQDPLSADMQRLQQKIRTSPRVQSLLHERDEKGKIPFHPYAKWYGAHWLLAALADLSYPAGDPSLVPLREQVLEWLFGDSHQRSIKTIAGRVRRCASQEGNALYALLALDLADDRADELARRLMAWQWPDGGWNCDKNPAAATSSFHETLIPLRALACYARATGSEQAQEAAGRAAEVFLSRRLYKRLRDGRIIDDNFVKLHYPSYWHYDILAGLKVMAEAGFIGDERCHDALNVLLSKQLPDGGFPAEAKYYRMSNEHVSGRSPVDWGGTSQKRLNEFVTVDALYVLKAAGRLRE